VGEGTKSQPTTEIRVYPLSHRGRVREGVHDNHANEEVSELVCGQSVSTILESSTVKAAKLKHNYIFPNEGLCAVEHKQVFLGNRLEIN
jgi:hypothetical protein